MLTNLYRVQGGDQCLILPTHRAVLKCLDQEVLRMTSDFLKEAMLFLLI